MNTDKEREALRHLWQGSKTESEQAAEYWIERAVTTRRSAVEALRAGDLTGEAAQAVHAAAERMRRGEEQLNSMTFELTNGGGIYRRIVEVTEEEMRKLANRAELELASKRAPIIAVDFDGTLCENAWPGIGAAKWETLQALIAAQSAGARLILWTNRVGARLREAVEWCRQHELEFDAVNENLPETLEAYTTNPRKVCADIYLDDKAAQPSAMVLERLWQTARDVMNEDPAGLHETAEQPDEPDGEEDQP